MQTTRAEEDAYDSATETAGQLHHCDPDTLIAARHDATPPSVTSSPLCNTRRQAERESSDVTHRNKRDAVGPEVIKTRDSTPRKMTSQSGHYTPFRVADILRPSTCSAERKPGKHCHQLVLSL